MCSNSDETQCRPVNAKEAFFAETDYNLPQRECALAVLRKYFGINKTHVLGRICPEKEYNAIHVRSGDISAGKYNETTGQFVSAEVHPDYGLFPTSYFMNTVLSMRKSGNSRVLVICEDLSNPTCDMFKTITITDKNIEVQTGRTLKEDLQDLLCATEVAMSFGTFRILFKLSERIRTVHEFSKSTQRGFRMSVGAYNEVLLIHEPAFGSVT